MTGRQQARRAPTILALAAVALPFGMLLARLAAEPPTPVRLSADFALTELATREAAQGARLLGPWSRFGWNHPGPAYFYVLAPFYRLGGGPRALYAGALVVNLAAALGAVAVAARRGGRGAAMAAALVVLAFANAVGPERLRDLWNPFVVALPTLLFVVLCAAALTGSWLSLGAAALVGSFVAHTHVGTAPFAAVLLAVTVAVRWRRTTRRSCPDPAASVAGKLAALALAALLVAVWIPPLVEQLTAPSGNLSELARFAFARQPGHPLGEAVAAWTAAMTVVPFGLASTHELPPGPGAPRLLGVVGWLAAAAACVVVGRARGNRFAVALGGLSLLGAAVCAVLVTRVAGPLLGYVLYWMAIVPLSAVIGVGAAVRTWGGGLVRRALASAPMLAVAGLAVALTASTAQVGPVSDLSDERVDTVVDLVDREVDLSDGAQVLVGTATHGHGVWILVAGVVNELDRRGANVSLSRWLDRYGERFRPSGREELELLLGRVGAVDPALTVGAEQAGRAGNTEIFFRRIG